MLLPLDIWCVLTSPRSQPPNIGTCSRARVLARLCGVSGTSLCLCESVSLHVRWEQSLKRACAGSPEGTLPAALPYALVFSEGGKIPADNGTWKVDR